MNYEDYIENRLCSIGMTMVAVDGESMGEFYLPKPP